MTREDYYTHSEKLSKVNNRFKEKYDGEVSPIRFMESYKAIQRVLDERSIEFRDRPMIIKQKPKL